MAGTYDPARRKLALSPGAWINRPPNYDTVGMSGTVNADGTVYSGTIHNPACSTFSVRRGRSKS